MTTFRGSGVIIHIGWPMTLSLIVNQLHRTDPNYWTNGAVSLIVGPEIEELIFELKRIEEEPDDDSR